MWQKNEIFIKWGGRSSQRFQFFECLVYFQLAPVFSSYPKRSVSATQYNGEKKVQRYSLDIRGDHRDITHSVYFAKFLLEVAPRTTSKQPTWYICF